MGRRCEVDILDIRYKYLQSTPSTSHSGVFLCDKLQAVQRGPGRVDLPAQGVRGDRGQQREVGGT